jgi:hypothetical protein
LTSATSQIGSSIGILGDNSIDVEDRKTILLRKYTALQEIVDGLKTIAVPIGEADTVNAWKIDAPVDVFHQLDRYINNHYEQLREVVTALYHEKPDIEFAVILYDAFKTQEQARDYRIAHEKEFRSEVFTVGNNGVTMLGPFLENRQRLDFYNKNTEALKLMMDQLESDHKLGKDLMDKRVKRTKAANIAECGPDHPGLAQYSSTVNQIKDLGVKKVLSREDQEQMEKAQAELQKIREDLEVPDDAIQVDVFFPQQNEDGETTMGKTKFYTQAEAPLHMQDGSQYIDSYQAVRPEGETVDSLRTKVITGRNGEKMEIKVPSNQ